MKAANLAAFLKFGKAKNQKFVLFLQKNHGWPWNCGGGSGAKLGDLCLPPGPGLKPPLTVKSVTKKKIVSEASNHELDKAAADIASSARPHRHTADRQNEAAGWYTTSGESVWSWYHNLENTATTRTSCSNRRVLRSVQLTKDSISILRIAI